MDPRENKYIADEKMAENMRNFIEFIEQYNSLLHHVLVTDASPPAIPHYHTLLELTLSSGT
jgi:hypothetical protein